MRLLLFILVLFTAVAVITDTKAAEWNEKPSFVQHGLVDEALIERGEILFSQRYTDLAVKDGFGGLSSRWRHTCQGGGGPTPKKKHIQ